MVSLSGDPTRFGTLPPHDIVRESVKKVLESGKYEGYAHSAGLWETRKAVADAFKCDSAPLTENVSWIIIIVVYPGPGLSCACIRNLVFVLETGNEVTEHVAVLSGRDVRSHPTVS